MTVRELIAELQKLDPGLPVYRFDSEYDPMEVFDPPKVEEVDDPNPSVAILRPGGRYTITAVVIP
jgi:hypothetical protein